MLGVGGFNSGGFCNPLGGSPVPPVPPGYVLIYSGGTAIPTGWNATFLGFGSLFYQGKNVYAAPSLLTLETTHAGDLDGAFDFSGTTGVTDINISLNAITALPALTGCTSLVTLNYGGLSITTGPDCTNLSALVRLDVSGNASMATPPTLTGCTALTTLYCYGTGITTGPNCTGLTLLQTIELSNNVSMATPPTLTGCAALTNLQLSGNPSMTTPPTLTDCTLLVSLDCSGTGITTGPDCSGLNSLATLNCHLNPSMTTIPNLTGGSYYQSINLSSNPLMAGVLDCSYLSLLYSLDMSGCSALTDAPVVASCASLVTVNLFDCTLGSSVDSLLNQLDANAAINGTVNTSSGTNQGPTSASAAARANLVTKGWTITVNTNPQIYTGVSTTPSSWGATFAAGGSLIYDGVDAYVSYGALLLTLDASSDSLDGVFDFSGVTSVASINISNNASMATPPTLTGCTLLATLNCSYTGITTGPDCTGLTALTMLDVSSNASMANAPTVSGCTSLATLNGAGCAMNSVDSIFTDLDTAGVLVGTADTSGGTNAAPGLTGLAAIANLQTAPKNWTITTN